MNGTGQVIHLDQFRRRRLATSARPCRDCRCRPAAPGSAWCERCTGEVTSRIADHRARKLRAGVASSVCAGCLDPIGSNDPAQIDQDTGEVFHAACAPITVVVDIEPS